MQPRGRSIGDPIFYQYQYFEDGMRQSEQDPLGHITTFIYDGLKRLKESRQTLGATTLTTKYFYDARDNLIKVTDPRGLDTTYTNGDLGWRLSTVSPDTGTTFYGYDEVGTLTSSLDANGVTTSRTYDKLNRPKMTTFGTDATLTVTNDYDSTAVTNGIGRRTSLTDASGSATFAYDRRGLLSGETRKINGVTFSTGYDYDKSGNLTELRFPSADPVARQGKVSYFYDNAERVSEVKALVGSSTVSVANTLQYKPFGPRTQLVFGNTLVDTRTYDSRYRLGTWTLGSGLLNYTHQFDDDSNLTGRTDNLVTDNSYDRTYGYDALHRLTTATGPWVEASTCPGGGYVRLRLERQPDLQG